MLYINVPMIFLGFISHRVSSSSSRELVLFRKNMNLLTDQQETRSIENLDDNNSVTSEEFDEEYDPMDVD